MRISNAALTIARNDSRTWLERLSAELARQHRAGRYPLRAAIASVTERDAVIESTFVDLEPRDRFRDQLTDIELTAPRRKDHQQDKFAVVQVIPTGVRCEIGGFAGDACPATNLLRRSTCSAPTHRPHQ